MKHFLKYCTHTNSHSTPKHINAPAKTLTCSWRGGASTDASASARN